MYSLIFALFLTAPASSAHGPIERCDIDLDARVTLRATGYPRYLLEDGILGPVAQVERVLKMMSAVRQRDLFDDVLQRMGPAIEVLPRVGDMIHLSEHLTQVNRGYQALTVRCARVSDTLKSNHDFVEAMISRSESVLGVLRFYLNERPGRDTAWVQDQIGRIHREIAEFRRTCFGNPPPQSGGILDTINRVLWP